MFSHATSVLPPFAKIKHDVCKPLDGNLKRNWYMLRVLTYNNVCN
jgi:hypothetical protein